MGFYFVIAELNPFLMFNYLLYKQVKHFKKVIKLNESNVTSLNPSQNPSNKANDQGFDLVLTDDEVSKSPDYP